MKRFALVLFAVLIAVPALAMADSACDHPQNNFDGLYCMNKVYQQADTDLNVTYRHLMPKLDASGKSRLRSTQIEWIKTRDQQCSLARGDAFYVDIACATRMTISRTQFLQARYRECISSGCLDRKLANPSTG